MSALPISLEDKYTLASGRVFLNGTQALVRLAMMQRERDAAFAEKLATWLYRLLAGYAERVLPFDLAAARRWGELSARIGHGGADLQIAATALTRGLTVATRNGAHFAPTGALVVNPFEAAG